MKIAYTYTILRYVHDVSVGESLNVGVVVSAPAVRFLGACFQPNYGRLRKLFPSLDGESYRQVIRYLQGRFDEVQRSWRDELALDVPLGNAEVVAASILARDDSSFQWSPQGGGITSKPAATLSSLYAKMVTINDRLNVNSGRNDDAIWSVYRAQLDREKVLSRLKSHRVVTENDEVEFKNAWENHCWHYLEPFSLDLLEPESIRGKAHRLLGQMYGVREAIKDHRLYLMVGEPQLERCKPTAEKVLNLLHKDLPLPTEIIREYEAADFSRYFAQKIREHELAG